MQVCYCIYICVHVKANLQSHSSGTVREGLLLGTWGSQIRLGWMFSELHGPAHLCLTSTGITSVQYQASLTLLGSEFGSLCLYFKHFTD